MKSIFLFWGDDYSCRYSQHGWRTSQAGRKAFGCRLNCWICKAKKQLQYLFFVFLIMYLCCFCCCCNPVCFIAEGVRIFSAKFRPLFFLQLAKNSQNSSSSSSNNDNASIDCKLFAKTTTTMLVWSNNEKKNRLDRKTQFSFKWGKNANNFCNSAGGIATLRLMIPEIS